MILYLDSSAILRSLLGQAGAVEAHESYSNVITSTLSEVECLRSVDRLRIREKTDDRRSVALREGVFRLLEEVEAVEITRTVLQRASQPMPTALGSLDAIHLATALLWRESTDEEVILATHDHALADAARASGFAVVGT